MKYFFPLLAFGFFLSCHEKPAETGLEYPITKTDSVSDNYFGTLVPDPYRWLENDTSSETEAWVIEQNKVTSSYLDGIPFRDSIRKRLEDLNNYERYGAPIHAGEYILFYKNDGLQNQSVIYIKKGESGVPEIFLDPNAIDNEGTTSLGIAGLSKDHKYITISISTAGSDWQKLLTYDLESRRPVDDSLEWVKFSGADWLGEGFYYSRYPAPEAGADYSGYNANHSVYYHRLGTDQSEDRLVYKDDKNPQRYHYVGVTEDEKYLILYVAEGTDGYEVHYKSLPETEGSFIPLFTGFEHKSSVVDHFNGRFLVRTDIDAPNYRLVSIDPSNPGKEFWKVVIPEEQFPLRSVNTAGGYLFGAYLKNAQSTIARFDMDGSNVLHIDLPGLGSAGGFGGEREDSVLFYSFSSYTEPGAIYRYDIKKNSSEIYFSPKMAFDRDAYISKQIFYKSKDGTEVSMFIVHRKDVVLDGNNPLLLYGYGGFNISITPYFSTYILPWLESGGIYAVPNLRGGGEYGESWHRAGMLLKKQNVFDDFISAAEYLIKNKYTSSEKLVISGRSNGGLLVGATMTQRPDLMKVALPGVGVMDMLRYHKFTVGHGWIPEYGSSEDSVNFMSLISYSPLHNLKEGVSYPATLIYTGDHDDRVVPAHSFKFAATLQAKTAGNLPCLIRIETNAGHGSGKPISKLLDEEADKLAFSFYHTGLKPGW